MPNRLEFFRFRRTAILICIFGPGLFGFASPSPAAAAITPNAPVQPLQAELPDVLDASRLTDGSSVTARVTEGWKAADCQLKPGALVQGHVSAVTRRSKAQKTSSFKLLFDHAPCKGPVSEAYSFDLIAMIGPPLESFSGGSSFTDAAPLADSPLNEMGIHAASQTSAGLVTNLANAALFNNKTKTPASSAQLPARIVPGQVIDLPEIELHVGSGAGEPATISARKGNARLVPRTTLILVPETFSGPGPHTFPAANIASTVAASTAGPERRLAPTISAADLPDETGICHEQCNALEATRLRSARPSDPVATLAISALGYAPHDKQRVLSFNRETTLTFLDEHHLLCTFDPHALRSRSSDGLETLRHVRAVMIDPTVPSVQGMVEWRVQGSDAYLWRYGQNQVLVHMGHELRLLDANLKPVYSLPLDGPLAWVVVSPTSDHVAIALQRQRDDSNLFFDTQAVNQISHQDLEVQVYDRDWKLVAASMRPTSGTEPVLSGGGELRVTNTGSGRWELSEYSWQRTEHALATVRSSCRPHLSVPLAGLTFVTGCMATSGNEWYRMLRSDGHTVLKAQSDSDELVQSSEGASGGLFAVRVFKADVPLVANHPFDRSDLLQEEIGIYRSTNGSRVASVITNDFILSRYAYALSPSGQEMAVAGKNAIAFYRLKTDEPQVR